MNVCMHTHMHACILTAQKYITKLFIRIFLQQILRLWFTMRRKARGVRVPVIPHGVPNFQTVLQPEILEIRLFQEMAYGREQIYKQLKHMFQNDS